jgi:hypothetical protein
LLSKCLVELGKLDCYPLEFHYIPMEKVALLNPQRECSEPFAAFRSKEMTLIFLDQIGVQNCLYAPLGAHKLGKHSHTLSNLPTTDPGLIVGDPNLRQEAACMELR